MEKSEVSLENWLAGSRNLNPKCGCEYRGRWFFCAYHEGVADAWGDAWGGGYTEGAEDHY